MKFLIILQYLVFCRSSYCFLSLGDIFGMPSLRSIILFETQTVNIMAKWCYTEILQICILIMRIVVYSWFCNSISILQRDLLQLVYTQRFNTIYQSRLFSLNWPRGQFSVILIMPLSLFYPWLSLFFPLDAHVLSLAILVWAERLQRGASKSWGRMSASLLHDWSSSQYLICSWLSLMCPSY